MPCLQRLHADTVRTTLLLGCCHTSAYDGLRPPRALFNSSSSLLRDSAASKTGRPLLQGIHIPM
jgi:hypothetical protein